MLRAIMDISARTSSLPEKASTDHKRLQIKLISRLRRHELHRKVAKATLNAVEIVRKDPDQVGFAVNPRRWVVERFFAWIGRNRRLAKDFEATIDSARAFLYAASVMLLVRRIARAS